MTNQMTIKIKLLIIFIYTYQYTQKCLKHITYLKVSKIGQLIYKEEKVKVTKKEMNHSLIMLNSKFNFEFLENKF